MNDNRSQLASAQPSIWPQETILLELLALLAILVLGVGLRTYHLGHKSLWLDELVYVRSAMGDGTLFGPFGYAIVGHPPGYLFLLRLLLSLGRDETLLRLPAMVASVGGIVAIWALGRSLLGPAEGLVAAFLLALSSIHVQYAQEAHSYALFATLSTLMLWALVRAAQMELARSVAAGDNQVGTRSKPVWGWLRRWGWFVLFSILNLYIHYYAAVPVGMSAVVFPCFLLAVYGGSVASLWRSAARRRAIVDLVVALAVVVLLYMPQLIWGLGASLEHAQDKAAAIAIGQAAERFEIGPQLLGDTFVAFVTNRSRWRLDPLFVWTTAAWLLIGLSWLLVRPARPGQGSRRALAVAALLWMLLPLPALAWFANRAGISFAPRRLLFALPMFLLLMAVGILALARLAGWLWQQILRGRLLRPQWITLAAALVLLAAFGKGSVDPLIAYYQRPKQDWKTLAQILTVHASGQDDAVAASANAAYLLSWYYARPVEVIEKDVVENLEALCRTNNALFFATAPGSALQLSQAERDWLAQNTIEVPLKLVQLYYRNCRPDVWYGAGAGAMLDMARHPDMPFRPTDQAFAAFMEELERRASLAVAGGIGADQAVSEPPLPTGEAATVDSAASSSPASDEGAASGAVPASAPPSTTPAPIPTPTPVPPNPAQDLGAFLAYQATANPQSAAAVRRHAVYLANHAGLDAAEDQFGRAVELAPDDWLTYAWWARALLAGGQQAEAVELVAQGLAIQPDQPALVALAEQLESGAATPDEADAGWRTTLDAGKEALRQKDWQAAVAAGQEAVAQAPQSHESHLLLGDAYRAAGQLEDALAAYQQAIYRAPHFGFLHARLGETLARLDRPDEALEAGLDAVALDDSRWESWLALGRAYAALAESQPALVALAEATLRQAVALAPADNRSPRVVLTDFLIAQGRSADALVYFRDLAAERPDDRDMQRTLADLLVAAGQAEEALAVYQGLVEADAQDRASRMALAATLAELGRVDEALAAYEAISTEWPNFPWSRVRAGELLENQGQMEAALDAYQAAVDASPDNPDLHFILAYAYRRAGQPEQAIAEFEAGLTLDPGREAARQALAELQGQP